jgi:small subunit ribosomal protein S2
LTKYFEGIRGMDKFPEALFIVDVKREQNALREGRRLNIPIVGIVDTNSDPDQVDYPIAGNDDAIRSVRLILTTLVQTISQARAEYEAKHARRKTEEAAVETPALPEVVAPQALLTPSVSPPVQSVPA